MTQYVREVLDLVRDTSAEALADHHVPGGAALCVQGLLDHYDDTLFDGRALFVRVDANVQHLHLHALLHDHLLDHGDAPASWLTISS